MLNRNRFKPAAASASKDPLPSSSPAFGTPVHPVGPSKAAPPPAPPSLKPTILPIILPPATLRPLAFRTFTKKHNLTLNSSALAALATFIGKHCGAGWRSEGLAERVLEEVAKAWKKSSSDVIVEDGELLKSILKTFESCMSGGRIIQGPKGLSRQSSFGIGDSIKEKESIGGRPTPNRDDSQGSLGLSALEVEDERDEDEASQDPRDWVTILSAFEQPRLLYNFGKKNFERSASKPSLFPPVSHKTEYFRQRYLLVQQRVLRNEAFQTSSFTAQRSLALQRSSSSTPSQINKITPIANLLGRTGTSHLLLGLITVAPTGTLALSDLTGSIALDLQHARPIPDENSAWFAPGMIVLVDGSYEEDYAATTTSGSSSALGGAGGIGGTIGGKFVAFSVGHPPPERRNTTLGIANSEADTDAVLSGPAFGWTDFLGLGSERATGARMRRLQQRFFSPRPQSPLSFSPSSSSRAASDSSAPLVAIAADVHLDNPLALTALRALLTSYASSHHSSPLLSLVLMGNFARNAALAGATSSGSVEYKAAFDALASTLGEFPSLLARTTVVLIPGPNDAWASAGLAGASTPLPQNVVPDLFAKRVKRAVADANREVWGRDKGAQKDGELVTATNPARLCWFGSTGEMVLCRDDVSGRLRRTAVRFRSTEENEDEDETMDKDEADRAKANGVDAGDDADDDDLAAGIAESTRNDESQPIDSDRMDIDSRSAKPNGTSRSGLPPSEQHARRLTKTLLDQAHLSPFPLSARPVLWDYGSALSLYPLPSALVLADAEAPAFTLNYMGCCVMNPGALVEGQGARRREARWVEYNAREERGTVRKIGV
ncbi:DNA polymerase alpha/epsilon subunit B-domain-containing protein [Lineolata rhizophorae]|uniref:DNA polymerase epsilon subunit B n=1 Tax=Lineolata rhizophorae TaxID=578093 RepID=A0A6A6P0D1_9PEZI|nr:DNA polymerase alpha/epsilon subunit B-domain-containing protein [Lineolata rhizophorae]